MTCKTCAHWQLKGAALAQAEKKAARHAPKKKANKPKAKPPAK